LSKETSGAPRSWLTLADGIAVQGRDLLILIARILIGLIFVMSGWGKLTDISGFTATLGSRGVPEFLGYIAPFVEFGGGLLLIFGLATRYASLVMLVFVVVATFISHRYWDAAPAQVANQFIHFWKNVTIMGGMVLLFASGAGRYALDTVVQRKQ
jgi:putative oxidoreductase